MYLVNYGNSYSYFVSESLLLSRVNTKVCNDLFPKPSQFFLLTINMPV